MVIFSKNYVSIISGSALALLHTACAGGTQDPSSTNSVAGCQYRRICKGWKGLLGRLRSARRVTVRTGSCISSESGLPPFRGFGGMWRTHRVEELASPQGFARDPHLVWTWYNERKAAHKRAQPNAGHLALVELESRVCDFTLATQTLIPYICALVRRVCLNCTDFCAKRVARIAIHAGRWKMDCRPLSPSRPMHKHFKCRTTRCVPRGAFTA